MPGVMLYFSIRPCMKRLTLEQKGRLFEAILDYGQTRQVPELEGVLGVAWDFIQERLDQDAQRYQNLLDKRKASGRKGGEATAARRRQQEAGKDKQTKQTAAQAGKGQQINPIPNPNPILNPIPNPNPIPNTHTDMGGEPHVCVRFSPPGVEEVRHYCQERGYKIDPEQFVYYYSSNGWMVGKNRMKDWRAAVRNWNRKEEQHGTDKAAGNDSGKSEPGWVVGTVL